MQLFSHYNICPINVNPYRPAAPGRRAVVGIDGEGRGVFGKITCFVRRKPGVYEYLTRTEPPGRRKNAAESGPVPAPPPPIKRAGWAATHSSH